MFNKSLLLIFFFLTLSWSPSQGQDYVTKLTSFSIEDGLSSRSVHYIYKDKRGFIWLGTMEGVNQFDGKDFKIFLREGTDIHTPINGGVFEDVNGNIWPLFEAKGKAQSQICHFLITTKNELIPIDEYYKNQIPFEANEVHFIYQTEDRHLYFLLNSSEVYKFDGHFSKIYHPSANQNSFTHIWDVLADGQIYLKTNQDLVILGADGKIIKQLSHPPSPSPSSSYVHPYFPIEVDGMINWYSLFVDKKNIHTIKVIKEDGSTRLMFKNPELVRQYFKNSERVSCTRERHKGQRTIILRDDQLLMELDLSGNIINDFTRDLLAVDNKISIAQGFYREGHREWIANNEGFSILDLKPNPFQHQLIAVPSYACRTIALMSNGNLIFLANSIAFEWNPINNEVKKLPGQVGDYGMIERKNGDLIFGSQGRSIIIYNYSLKEGRKVYSNLEYNKRNAFIIPFEDKNEKLWISSYKGLGIYNEKIDSIIPFQRYNTFQELSKKTTNFYSEEAEGLWLATTGGLYIMDHERGIIDFFETTADFNIQHFYREGDDFWLATIGDGFIKWNKKTDEIERYNQEGGFFDNRITAVYPDKSGYFWLPTYNGLTRFHRASKKVNTFFTGDGISHNEFNRMAHYQHTDGRLFFGGLNGINIFHPDSIKVEEQKDAPLFVTGYHELEGKTGVLTDKTSSLLKTEKIELAPSVTSFRIHFALLNYENADKTQYAYRIKGLEEDWNFQKENYIRINSLPFGKYTLEIKAQDYTGQWSTQELSIPITVIAPLYAQPKWLLSGLGFLALIVFLSVKWRLRYLEQAKEKLEQVVVQRTLAIDDQRLELENLNETKDRLFAILAHDLKNPVIAFEDLAKSVNYLLQSDEPERVLELGNYIEKEAVQLHHLLDNLLSWAMAQREELPIVPTPLSLIDVFQNVENTFKTLSNRSGIKLEGNLSENILVMADRRVLETVFRNLISNAFRYTKSGGAIKISAEKDDENVQIYISDNGLGMTDAEVKNLFKIQSKLDSKGDIATISLGLHLCKELMELLNGKISARSEKGKGTTLTLILPIGN